MHSCLFACHWKVLVGETPTLASSGVSVLGYGSRTMVRIALTRASLPKSMIDDEFEVCFELLLSVVLAKRRM
jgi:hypothetical protein